MNFQMPEKYVRLLILMKSPNFVLLKVHSVCSGSRTSSGNARGEKAAPPDASIAPEITGSSLG